MIISKKNLYKFIYVLIFLPFLTRFFTDNYGVSYAVMPLFDLWSVFILVLSYYIVRFKNMSVHILEFWFIAFLVVGVISISVNGDGSLSGVYYSGRPYMRMILSMLVSAIVLDFTSLKRIFKYLEMLLYLNVLFMTYQYIFGGLRQDIIGGTFGNSQGCNTIQNILCVFVFSVTLMMFLKKVFSTRRLILNTLVVLYVASLAEINLLYLEVLLIVIIALLFNKEFLYRISLNKILIFVSALIISLAALILFIKFNPDRVFLFSTQNILEYLGFNEGSTGVYRISRLRVFSQLGNSFFRNDELKWLFGFGLGNCSSHSEFYRMFSDLQYTYFSSSITFLETGYFGVLVNIGAILTTMFLGLSIRKKVINIEEKAYIEVSIIMSVILIMMFFYNTTLRDSYTAFLSGTIIIAPYLIEDSQKQSRKENYSDIKKSTLHMAWKK